MLSLERDGVFAVGDRALAVMRAEFSGRAVSEDETLACMRAVWNENGVVIDPHTAVGVVAGRGAMRDGFGGPLVHLSTAHPAKFPDAVEDATGEKPQIPPRLARLLDLPERYDTLPADPAAVQAYIDQRAIP